MKLIYNFRAKKFSYDQNAAREREEDAEDKVEQAQLKLQQENQQLRNLSNEGDPDKVRAKQYDIQIAQQQVNVEQAKLDRVKILNDQDKEVQRVKDQVTSLKKSKDFITRGFSDNLEMYLKKMGKTRSPYALIDVTTVSPTLNNFKYNNDQFHYRLLKNLLERSNESYPGRNLIPISKSDFDKLKGITSLRFEKIGQLQSDKNKVTNLKSSKPTKRVKVYYTDIDSKEDGEITFESEKEADRWIASLGAQRSSGEGIFNVRKEYI